MEYQRGVLAVEPPASAHGDACGIVVAALGADGIARVLADCSIERASPERWALAVANAAHEWQADRIIRSEEHTSELQSLMRISYAGFCLKKKNTRSNPIIYTIYRSNHIKK